MKTKENYKQLLVKVTEKHRSGDGHKKMSKLLNIHWSTVKPIITQMERIFPS